MNNTLRRSLFCTTAITALAAAAPHGAMATSILGGGSTLAAPTYYSEFSDDGLGNFSFCSIGSGAGTSAFVSNSDTPLLADTSHCPSSYPTAKPVDFGASDAYISSTNVTVFGSSNAGPLIQVPMFGTPVTFALSSTLGSKSITTNGAETLTDAQLCGIYSGTITDWHTIDSSIASGTTINVAYRLDSSGTSFLLTSHLKAVCTDGTTFSTAQLSAMPTNTFASSLFGSGFPSGSSFTGGTGSSGVQSVVHNTSNSIGYLSPDYTDISSNGHAQTVHPFVAKVKNGNDLTAYLPTVTDTATAIGTITAPTGAAETTPSNWAPPLFDTALSNPAHGYPVAGYTYWIVATCYNNSTNSGAASALIGFLQDHYNVSGATGTLVDDIIAGGFVPVSGSSDSAAVTSGSYAAAINAAFLAGGDGQHLNIANTGASSTNPTQCGSTVTGR